jgi:hypothetical protein
MEAARASG